MTTNNNRYFAIIFPSALLAVALVLTLFMFSGCNTTKRAERKLDKSIRLDPMPFIKKCAENFNPADSIHEKIIYKPGATFRDTIFETDVQIINDTVYLTKVKTVTIKTVDTVDASRFQRDVNRAENDSLRRHYDGKLAAKDKEITGLKEKVASQATTIKYLWVAAGLGWLLILVWVVKKIWFKK